MASSRPSHSHDQTTDPRHKTSAVHSPFSSIGRTNLISMTVFGSGDWSVRRSTQEMLMLSMAASHRSVTPRVRYRSTVPNSYRWDRATPVDDLFTTRFKLIPSPRTRGLPGPFLIARIKAYARRQCGSIARPYYGAVPV